MQLGILLAVVATIMISEHAPAQSVESGWAYILLTSVACLGVVAFATGGSWAISRAIRLDVERRQTWLQWFARFQQWHMAVWLAAIGCVIYFLHWPQVVRYNWGLDQTIVLRDLIILGPIWIPLLLSWAAFYEVERAAWQVPPEASSDRATGSRRGEFVWLRARHYLGLCLLPILVLLAFQDLATLLLPGWKDSPYGWVLYLVPLVLVTLFFPQLLSRIWQTASLPAGGLRTRLDRLSRRFGVGTRDFKIWCTRGQLFNAAVAGMLPSLRYVLITDALLSVLRDEEVEAVVAHELGHVRRRHLWFRMLLLALPVWIMGIVQVQAPEFSDYCSEWLNLHVGNSMLLNSLLIPALAVSYAVIALGYYSRALEHDADLSVYEDGQGAVFCITLDRLSCLSSDRRHQRSWLHPSTAARIHLLQRAMVDPQVAHRYRQRVNRFNYLLLAAWILTPAFIALV